MLNNLTSKTKIKQAIEKGWVTRRKHPVHDFYVLNYSKKAQISWHWTIETILCRGLIVDGDFNVIERPFAKFFSLDQWRDLRNSVHNLFGVCYKDMFTGPIEVTDKIDGSMGVLYHDNSFWALATRGSFESEQAVRGTEILRKNYGHHLNPNPNYTYIFEIIYPENRIVVDYGEVEDVVLTAIIDKKTGRDVQIDRSGRPSFRNLWMVPSVAQVSHFSDFQAVLSQKQTYNKEGYVVRFTDTDIRVKVKFDEYLRLHKIVAGLDSDKQLLEIAKSGDLSIIPDEFIVNVRAKVDRFRQQFNRIEQEVKDILDKEVINNPLPLTRKSLAQKYKQYRYFSILFSMLDGKQYSDMIWRFIKQELKKDA